MDPALLFQLLGTAGTAAIATAVIQGVFSRKRLGAEATQIIQTAASGVVIMLEKQVAEKTATIDECVSRERALEKRVRDLEDEREDQRQINQMHAAWDYLAHAELQIHASKLPPPPPLYPPRRSRAAPRVEV